MCDEAARAGILAALGSVDHKDALADAMCLAASSATAGSSRKLLEADSDTVDAVNNLFVLVSAFLVFFMQAGFALLCAGSVRQKNAQNILLKNVLDACAGAISFYLFGYGIAYGETSNASDNNEFIGTGWFALENYNDWTSFLFQWAFAAAAATIVSGSVAERCKFEGYLIYSVCLTGFIYPIVVHWVWSNYGWLSAFKADPLMDVGMLDFAGSGVVHMVGGFAGLAGAAVIGPRIGRFDADGKAVAIPGHSSVLVVTGTFILWLGWYGFNPGSALAIVGGIAIPSRAAVTTTLSGAAAGLTALCIAFLKDGVWDLLAVCNGLLAGLVAVTAGCSVLEPWAAILCGAIGAAVFAGAEQLLVKLRIDDPLSAAPMHGFTGAFGVIWVGLMAKKEYVKEVYGEGAGDWGLFYGGSGELLGCQIIGVLAIAGWTCGTMFPLFMVLKATNLLRAPADEERLGLDESHHGGSAYPGDSTVLPSVVKVSGAI